MNFKRNIASVCVLLFAIFLNTAISTAQDYRIRERDVLKITVYEHPDLTIGVRVSGDGTITFPLLGNIKVAGLTEKEAGENILRLLADGYIINPQVSILVEEYKDFVYVTGEIKKPGAYPFEEGMTVLKAVTLAGGFTDKASVRRIKILRGTVKINTAPDEKATDKKNEKDNNKNNNTTEIKAKAEDPIYPNDIIVVPESFF